LTDFQTTKKTPWWEKAPEELLPFRRDFYTNVQQMAPSDVAAQDDGDNSDSLGDEE